MNGYPEDTAAFEAPADSSFQTEGAELEAEPIAEPGDAAVVERLIAADANTRYTRSRRNCRELYDRITACESLYRGRRRDSVSRAISNEATSKLEQTVELQEASNQVDMLVAIILSAIRQQDLYKVSAINGESQFKADTTKSVLDAQCRAKRYLNELEKFINRFVKHPIAGLKTCIEYDEWEENDRKSFPLQPMGPQDMPPQGSRFVAMDQPHPDMAPVGKLYDVKTPRSQWSYFFKAVETRSIAFSDMHRPIHEQSSVHEDHFVTIEDLRNDKSLLNTEQFYGESIPPANGYQRFYGLDINETGTEGNPGESPEEHGIYCLTESWFQVGFRDYFDQGGCTIDDLLVFCEKHQIETDELTRPQKWCVKHMDDKDVYSVYPNYLPTKRQYPYEFESFIMGDSELVGQSFLERLADFDSFLQAMVNLLRKNCMMRLYMSVVSSKRTKFSKEDLKELMQPFGFKKLEGTYEKIEDVLHFVEVPDLSVPAMNAINWIIGRMQSIGLSSTLQGLGGEDTATESSISNQNGQKKVASALGRAANNVILPMIENMRDLTFLNFDEPRWIDMVGEGGSVVSKTRYVSPGQITNRFRIVMTASYDYMVAEQRAQQLIALLNVLIPVGLPPERLMTIVELILQYMGHDRDTIDKVTGAMGTRTDVMDEIKTLIENPVAEVPVNESDNHQLALQVLSMAMDMYPGIEEQWNVQKYQMDHEHFAALQEQEQMAEQAGPPGAGRPAPPKGPPRQPAPPARNPEAIARQGAQHRSTPDRGNQTSGGITGRAAPPRLAGVQ
jgi:hypothetical protein